ncbi:MAG: hypothetical protein FWE08_07290 [Oscillospiraceae bacterium]|nr:hypothetical protein [Oscillospiraceae bacterium]
MELFKEILINVLQKEEVQVTFPGLTVAMGELIDSQAYEALEKIKAIIQNDSLSEFMCIEEIVCVLEAYGSSGGNRHDF